MPRGERFEDTMDFIGRAADYRINPFGREIVRLLENYRGAIPPAVDEAMSFGRSGTSEERKIRRAIVLLRCLFFNTRASAAQRQAQLIAEPQLIPTLADVMRMTLRAVGRQRVVPLIDRMMADPETFLSENRMQTGYVYGRSTEADFDFYFDPDRHIYKIDPPAPNRELCFAPIRAYSFHVLQFADVVGDAANVPGVVSTEDLCITTQLSGCSVLYRVNGPQLTVAHVQPSGGFDWNGLGEDIRPFAGIGSGPAMGKYLEYYGGLSGVGGTLGLYRNAPSDEQTGFREGERKGNGAERMNTHGYFRNGPYIYAYFIAIRRAGSWQIFGQENDRDNPDAGIKRFQRLYPL